MWRREISRLYDDDGFRLQGGFGDGYIVIGMQ